MVWLFATHPTKRDQVREFMPEHINDQPLGHGLRDGDSLRSRVRAACGAFESSTELDANALQRRAPELGEPPHLYFDLTGGRHRTIVTCAQRASNENVGLPPCP